MKKFAFAAAAAGLMSLAACQQGGGETNTVAANMAEDMEAQADNLEAAADNAAESPATANQAGILENLSENASAQAENLSEAAENGAAANTTGAAK